MNTQPCRDHLDPGEADLVGLSRTMIETVASDPRIMVFAESVDALIAQARETFAREEQAMSIRACDDHRTHALEHKRFLERAEELRGSLSSRYDLFDCWGVVLYLYHWIQNHSRNTSALAG